MSRFVDRIGRRLLVMVAALGAAGANPAETPSTVLFVCEHGSAKSVMAAAHFNRLAAAEGIAARAVSRGTAPDAELAPAARRGLRDDGISIAGLTPRALTQEDLDAAERVVAFVELPGRFTPPEGFELWHVPAVSDDYGTARDAIVERVRGLLDELAAGGAGPQASDPRPAEEK